MQRKVFEIDSRNTWSSESTWRKIIFSIGIILFCCQTMTGQISSGSTENIHASYVKQHKISAAPGTYQFIVSSEKEDPFTSDILVWIESNRDEVQEKTLALTPHTSVRIPSGASIRKAEFKPMKEVVYIKNPTSAAPQK